MRRFIALQVVSALVLLSGLVAAVLLCAKVIDLEQAELRSEAEAHGQRIASQIEAGIIAAIEPLERLGQWWLSQGKPAAAEDWATDGQLFLSRSPGLRKALWIGTDGLQRWAAAPGATPATASARPEALALQQIARIRKGEPKAISEVFSAPGIGPAIYVCVPVTEARKLRGYVVGLYDATELVAAIAKGVTLNKERIAVAAGGRRIYGNGRSRQSTEDSASAAIHLANQVWNLELVTPLHYFQEFRSLILSVIAVVGALIYSFIVSLGLSHRWSTTLQQVNSALESEVQLRTRAELEVRDLNAELYRKVADFETLLEVIPVGIAVAYGPECRNVRVNPALAEMLGVPKGNLTQTSAAVNRGGCPLPPEQSPMQIAAATGTAVLGQEDQIVRADGAVFDVLCFAAPLLDQNKRVRGVLNVAVNVTERKRLEKRLQTAERMRSLGAMSAGIAHDFNNILTSILGEACLAAELVPKESIALPHIQASIDATQQASSLIHKVLAYTGHSPHTLKPVDLGEAIKSVHPWLSTLAAPKATLHLDIAPYLPNTLADANEVRKALRNLVLNAAEAVPEKGAIQIRVDGCELSGNEPQSAPLDENSPAGTYIRVEVKDSGTGMPPEIAERAFDPFFSTKFLGRGLGLSEVLGIMRAHNGTVRLETKPSAGTSVQLLFPVTRPPRAA